MPLKYSGPVPINELYVSIPVEGVGITALRAGLFAYTGRLMATELPLPEAEFPKITLPVTSNDNTLVGVVETVVPEFKLLNLRPLVPAVGELTTSPGLMVMGC